MKTTIEDLKAGRDQLQKNIADQIKAFEEAYPEVVVKEIASVTTRTAHGEWITFIPKIEIKGL